MINLYPKAKCLLGLHDYDTTKEYITSRKIYAPYVNQYSIKKTKITTILKEYKCKNCDHKIEVK